MCICMEVIFNHQNILTMVKFILKKTAELCKMKESINSDEKKYTDTINRKQKGVSG